MIKVNLTSGTITKQSQHNIAPTTQQLTTVYQLSIRRDLIPRLSEWQHCVYSFPTMLYANNAISNNGVSQPSIPPSNQARRLTLLLHDGDFNTEIKAPPYSRSQNYLRARAMKGFKGSQWGQMHKSTCLIKQSTDVLTMLNSYEWSTTLLVQQIRYQV